MALGGDIITSAVAATGRVRVAALAEDFRASAQAVAHALGGEPVVATTLRPATRSQAIRAAEAIADAPLVWADDNYCLARAHFSAHLINRELGVANGPQDAAYAALAFVESDGGSRLANRWTYHVAPAMRVDDELIVFDPATAARPITSAEWMSSIGATRAPVLRPTYPLEREAILGEPARRGLKFWSKPQAPIIGYRSVPHEDRIRTLEGWMKSTWSRVEQAGQVPEWPAAVG